jgi:peptidoglycan-associated lipoprotein
MSVQTGRFRHLLLIVCVVSLCFGASCSSGKKKGDADSGLGDTAGADENVSSGDSDSGKAMGLQTVHFPYDSSVLDDDAKRVLDSNAQILKEKNHLRIQIEGHCDQRGGIQYNIALGEKRANAVKNYLEKLGISADRVSIISFGKEKPIDPSESAEAYAKNRRGNFVITST